MYLETPVPVPDVPGKLTFREQGKGSVYVNFEYARTYDPVRKYTIAKRSAIGKLVDPEDRSTMLPNENYVMYFASELPKDCEPHCVFDCNAAPCCHCLSSAQRQCRPPAA